ncbi:hypothetical protein EYF80_057019 [Liparis tanakae]|uniref:Secreted protein n=1 Tax=Liparis tanakae TaxID=230148 RepID=A0A4Z2EVI6_9TELE|nr:hypothetical protein EYF80_057019 [Liparis tanakae]
MYLLCEVGLLFSLATHEVGAQRGHLLPEGRRQFKCCTFSHEGTHLKVVFVGAAQQRLAAAADVGHARHEQEGRVVGEDVVKEPEPLVPGQDLGEQRLQQGPHVELGHRDAPSDPSLEFQDGRPPVSSGRFAAVTCEVTPQSTRCCSSSWS